MPSWEELKQQTSRQPDTGILSWQALKDKKDPQVPQPGRDAVQVKRKSADDSIFQPWNDFKTYTKENFEAGKSLLKEPGITKNVAGVAAMAAAPFGGAMHAAVSKPLERTTGVPADSTDLALSFTPVGVGTAAGLAGKAAKQIPGVAKVGTAIRESAPVKAVEKLVSPTTASKEAGIAEGIIREQRGLAERSTKQAEYKLAPHYEHLSGMPEPAQLGFINRIETFSKNNPLPDPKAEKAAGELRGIYQSVKNDLLADPNFDQMGFVNDYYPHMWQDQKAAQQFISNWVSKAGSGRSTQARKIPTIEEGLKARLKLKSTNPAETTMQYVANMYNYKALKGAQSSMSAQGIRKFSSRGGQQPGWVELKGPGNKVMYVDKKGIPHENVAYAPEDVARVYNNYYSPGLSGPLGSIAHGIRSVVNGGTQMVLGLSGYHYRLIANEATTAAFSKGMGRALKGDIKGAGKALAGGTPYLGAARQFKQGRALKQQYLTGKGGLDNKVIDYITRAGGRMVGIDKTMKTGGPGSYFNAWKQGSLKASVAADLMDVKGGSVFKAIGKVMDDVNRPLFAETIPNIKNSVNYEMTADWIKQHPQATEQEILKATRDIVDATDNSMGELIQDNIFWNKKFKESLQLLMLSTGWAVGTGRQVLGGTKDLATAIMDGKELSPRARYIIALPIAHMLHASVYQYLKTGTLPQQPQDLIYPKTGGVSPYGGAPERSMPPSQLKDIIGYQKHPGNELYNKLAPVWKTVMEMATNSDWRGDPIYYQYAKDAPGPVQAYAKYLLGAFEPIGVKGATQGPERGSNIGRTERLIAGSRPAGMEKEAPQAYQKMMKWNELKREKKGIRHQKVDESRHKQ